MQGGRSWDRSSGTPGSPTVSTTPTTTSTHVDPLSWRQGLEDGVVVLVAAMDPTLEQRNAGTDGVGVARPTTSARHSGFTASGLSSGWRQRPGSTPASSTARQRPRSRYERGRWPRAASPVKPDPSGNLARSGLGRDLPLVYSASSDGPNSVKNLPKVERLAVTNRSRGRMQRVPWRPPDPRAAGVTAFALPSSLEVEAEPLPCASPPISRPERTFLSFCSRPPLR